MNSTLCPRRFDFRSPFIRPTKILRLTSSSCSSRAMNSFDNSVCWVPVDICALVQCYLVYRTDRTDLSDRTDSTIIKPSPAPRLSPEHAPESEAVLCPSQRLRLGLQS